MKRLLVLMLMLIVIPYVRGAGFDAYPLATNVSGADLMILERLLSSGARQTMKIYGTNVSSGSSTNTVNTAMRGSLLYVDPTSMYGGSPERGNINKPWLTFSNALYSVSNNETIVLLDGVEYCRGFGNSSIGWGADNSLYQKTNITISASDGYLLVSTNHGDMIFINKCKDILIRGLNISAFKSYTNQYAPSFASNSVALHLGTNSGIILDGCRFFQAERHATGSLTYMCENVVIRNCFFDKIGSTNVPGGAKNTDGSAIVGVTKNWQIQNNYFGEVCAGSVEAENNNDPNFPLQNLLISGNYFLFGGYSCITVGGYSTNIANISIVGNLIISNSIRPTIPVDNAPSFVGIQCYGGKNITIAGNNIRGLGYGIAIRADTSARAMANITIADNVISDSVFNAINVSDTVNTINGFAITGNTLDNNFVDDIIFSGTDSIISNNTIKHRTKSVAAYTYGVHLYANILRTSNILVQGNMIFGTGNRGIGMESGCTNICLRDNFVTVPSESPYTNFGGTLVCPPPLYTFDDSLRLSTNNTLGGFAIHEGFGMMGSVALSSGAATVSTSQVRTNSRIKLTPVATANVISAVGASNIVTGTSFRIHSTSGADANRIDWEIIQAR